MSWAAVATVAVGAISTGVGSYQSNKANKATYTANAKIVTAIDEMIQTLLGLKR